MKARERQKQKHMRKKKKRGGGLRLSRRQKRGEGGRGEKCSVDMRRDFDLAFALNCIDSNCHPGLVKFKVQKNTVQSSKFKPIYSDRFKVEFKAQPRPCPKKDDEKHRAVERGAGRFFVEGWAIFRAFSQWAPNTNF